MRKTTQTIKNKLPSIEDQGQTDCVTILVNQVTITLDLDLDFQSPASYGHDQCMCKNFDQRSVGSKARAKTNGRTDGQDRLQYLARQHGR